MVRLLAFLCLLQPVCGDDYQGHTGRWIEVIATAYSPLDAFTRSTDPHTASGRLWTVHPYGIAVDPEQIPYGSRLIVPLGNGYLDQTFPVNRVFVCDDTGSIIKRRTREIGQLHIDLRYQSVYSALKFGKKTLKVFLIED